MNGLIPKDFWTFPKISISPMVHASFKKEAASKPKRIEVKVA